MKQPWCMFVVSPCVLRMYIMGWGGHRTDSSMVAGWDNSLGPWLSHVTQEQDSNLFERQAPAKA